MDFLIIAVALIAIVEFIFIILMLLRRRGSANDSDSQLERSVMDVMEQVKEQNRELREERDRLLLKMDAQERELREERAALQNKMEILERDRREESERLRLQMEEISRHNRQMAALEFKNLAHNVVKEGSDAVRKENEASMSSLLDPLREQISEFRRAFTDSYVKDNATRQSLSDQVERLIHMNVSLGEEARRLSVALTGEAKKMGDWGESILETLLEESGMVKNVNFFVQPTVDNEGQVLKDKITGRSRRPDVIVKLPDDRILIIDSKVSLSAFVEYNDAADKDVRKQAGKRHIDSVRKHIDEIAKARYQNLYDNAPEHVLMFIPNEGAWSLAFSLDPNLWKYAFEKKVAVVSGTHLFSVMQIISSMWRQEKQTRNAQEIAKLAGLLYDSFVRFCDDMQNIGQSLSKAHNSYEKCLQTLSRGSHSLISRAERLHGLGAKVGPKKLPKELLNDSEDADYAKKSATTNVDPPT